MENYVGWLNGCTGTVWVDSRMEPPEKEAQMEHSISLEDKRIQ